MFKGSDRQCMVVELSMQCCGQVFWDSFETYKTFQRCIITEFACKVDVKNYEFEWDVFRIDFFKIIK